MSGYILCQTKKAEVPFFIENISTNIYTLEELCYYLYHNLCLIDQTLINENLCDWLSNELGLTELAGKLRPNVGKFASAEDILYPIFKEINYLTYEELRTLNGELAKLDAQPPAIREKQKGDALVENGMYVNAIHVYQRLLERGNLEQAREGLTAEICHNLGCAYSYLFQMEKAAECFFRAYEESKNKDELIAYFLAYKSVKTPIEYESRMQELKADEEIQKGVREALNRFVKLPEKPVYSQHIDELLDAFTREYHRSTGA
ncbi:MAG TPA: hypothetical protein IAA21_03565 [Candidatus Blautia faecigallinarum]|uniref:Tetratricopeptide repeat protein n=1 Tax=Candidatus Blautia faecigallinarum TaxID=2838488 RepID=A0A9D2DRH4_9FIRM|nr:hypothetical protein [Candidatus Blautia faecigallinarum]